MSNYNVNDPWDMGDDPKPTVAKPTVDKEDLVFCIHDAVACVVNLRLVMKAQYDKLTQVLDDLGGMLEEVDK